MKRILSRLKFCWLISNDLASSLYLMKAYFLFSFHIRRGQKGRDYLNGQHTTTIRINLHKKVVELEMRIQDIVIFLEVFEERVYDQGLTENISDWIIDLGANIGLSALYFHHQLGKQSQILCVEPSRQNLPLLKTNTKRISNIIIERSAVDSKEGTVHFNDSKFGHTSKIDDQSNSTYTVETMTMNTLLTQYNISSVGLLKIDIEGKEIDILTTQNSWLEKVKNLVIEIHDEAFKSELDRIMLSYNFKKHIIKNDIFWYQK